MPNSVLDHLSTGYGPRLVTIGRSTPPCLRCLLPIWYPSARVLFQFVHWVF